MKKWPKQHARLSAVMLIFVLLIATVYILLIRPLAVKVSDARSYISFTKGELGRTGWPLDPSRLETYVQMKKGELDGTVKDGTVKDNVGMRKKSQLVLAQCTAMLNNKIHKTFGNSSDFAHDVTRLDYQEVYNELEQRLASKDIFLSEDLLGLGEKTQSPNIYQLVLQAWMLDKLTSLIMESGLRIQTDDKVIVQDEKGRKKPAVKMQFMPMIEYRLYEEDKTPYVLEIPIRIALYGNVDSLWTFLRQLQSDGNFLPASQIQMAMLPDVRNDDAQLSVEAKNMRVEIECSAFFCPLDKAAGDPANRKPPPPKTLPEGA